MSDLPSWPGAATVYERCQRINAALCRSAYEAACREAKRRGGKPIRFYAAPAEVTWCVAALNRGDNEEGLKAYVAQHLSLALDAAA